MTDEPSFARAQRFERRIRRDVAARMERFEWGTAYFDPNHPLVWDLNFLEVEAVDAQVTADDLVAVADRIQGAVGLGHRRIVVDDDTVAESLAPRFRELDWMVNKFLFMELKRAAERPPRVRRAREIDRDNHRDVYVRTTSEAPYGGVPDVVRQLADHTDGIAARTGVRYFGAIDDDGTLASICVMFSDGEIAQIEDVATLKDYRGRGLATELLGLAISEAKEAAHDLIFLVADEEDWPKDLYGKLGFEPMGLSYDFVLPGDVVYGNENH
ncbi:MAG: GNAT family N-acetyltransferase [Actinobacteria bacterium]|nr:GNAT family N-acetyltransferase [Actinomycetota bacterium]